MGRISLGLYLSFYGKPCDCRQNLPLLSVVDFFSALLFDKFAVYLCTI